MAALGIMLDLSVVPMIPDFFETYADPSEHYAMYGPLAWAKDSLSPASSSSASSQPCAWHRGQRLPGGGDAATDRVGLQRHRDAQRRIRRSRRASRSSVRVSSNAGRGSTST